ncbi:MAG TPA: kelch repeat-containing protein [Verrucomicrobiae bacterium]|nr:kelch repeat-containing protein [Verrucomicrobiae bacterium]
MVSKTVLAAGTWTPLVNLPPAFLDTMLLLSDGTVMATDGGNGWYRLTPDIHGSYVYGTWSLLAPMNDTRLYFASDVLRDGRLFVAGGEYGTGSGTAEIYDPLTNGWTELPTSSQNFDDAISTVLPDGDVLIAPLNPSVPGTAVIYNVVSNTWSIAPSYFQGNGTVVNQQEASWVKLPDDSILTIDPSTINSERFIPSLNEWIGDAAVPVFLFDGRSELGPAVLLTNGQVFFTGASGHTALYTPSGNTTPGSWTAGPDIPDGLVAADAPCAMLVNGKVLCAFGPSDWSIQSTSFLEYDPASNAFNAIAGPTGTNYPMVAYGMRMLDLPDGTVLLSVSGPNLYVYRPDGSPIAAGKPAITSITTNADGSYFLSGKLLNGISSGAAYGDDAQMDSNYPLVRMTDANGNVYYARTANWSSTGVMTGNAVVTTQFWLPASLPPGTYSLVAVANGIGSDPVLFPYNTATIIVRAAIINGGFALSWNAVVGQSYHIQYETNSTQTDWLDLVGAITATNYIISVTDTNVNAASPQKFYRIVSP